MHPRVSAWALASCAAPALVVASMVPTTAAKEGLGALVTSLFWYSLLAFEGLILSLALLSPLLLLPLERRVLSSAPRSALMALTLVVAVAFMAALIAGWLGTAVLLGLALNAIVFLLIVHRPLAC
jgi:ABC-type protease/lipase transport system fused ATPase/permease subunit